MQPIDSPEKKPDKKSRSMIESIINDSNKGDENAKGIDPMIYLIVIGLVIALVFLSLG